MNQKTRVAASELEDGLVLDIAFLEGSEPLLNLRAGVNLTARQIVPRSGKGFRRLRVAAHAAMGTRDESFVRRQRLSTCTFQRKARSSEVPER